MIKLDVKQYCENCPHFDPEADIITDRAYIGSNITATYTTIKCKNRDRCHAIAISIEGALK